MIVIICAIMVFCLAIFLAYHIRLAIRNETTNEECKRDEILFNLRRELKIIKALIKECDEEKDDDDKLRPIRVDGEDMPATKKERLLRYGKMLSSCKDRKNRLITESPYKPRSFINALKQIMFESE